MHINFTDFSCRRSFVFDSSFPETDISGIFVTQDLLFLDVLSVNLRGLNSIKQLSSLLVLRLPPHETEC